MKVLFAEVESSPSARLTLPAKSQFKKAVVFCTGAGGRMRAASNVVSLRGR